MTVRIGNVEFDGDRIVLTYMDDSTDLRNRGLLMATHQLTVLQSPAYQDEIDALTDAAKELLQEALDDFQDTEPVPLVPDEPEEDESDD